jgi:hypothetical protein
VVSQRTTNRRGYRTGSLASGGSAGGSPDTKKTAMLAASTGLVLCLGALALSAGLILPRGEEQPESPGDGSVLVAIPAPGGSDSDRVAGTLPQTTPASTVGGSPAPTTAVPATTALAPPTTVASTAGAPATSGGTPGTRPPAPAPSTTAARGGDPNEPLPTVPPGPAPLPPGGTVPPPSSTALTPTTTTAGTIAPPPPTPPTTSATTTTAAG